MNRSQLFLGGSHLNEWVATEEEMRSHLNCHPPVAVQQTYNATSSEAHLAQGETVKQISDNLHFYFTSERSFHQWLFWTKDYLKAIGDIFGPKRACAVSDGFGLKLWSEHRRLNWPKPCQQGQRVQTGLNSQQTMHFTGFLLGQSIVHILSILFSCFWDEGQPKKHSYQGIFKA